MLRLVVLARLPHETVRRQEESGQKYRNHNKLHFSFPNSEIATEPSIRAAPAKNVQCRQEKCSALVYASLAGYSHVME